MAGIGFALRQISRGDDLQSLAVGFGSAAFISSGPWVMTVIALVAINGFMAVPWFSPGVESFRTILIYNFAFSLTLTGPFTYLTTRLLSDQIYFRNVEGAPGLLFGSLTVSFAVEGAIAAAFYGLVPDMPPALRLLCVVNYLTIVALWQVTIFLSALKDFGTISLSFAAGLAAGILAAVSLGYEGNVIGLLGGFTIGIGVTVFVVIARIFAEYPYPITRPFDFLSSVKVYWELPVAGLLYNAAIWVDKWTMWFGPDRLDTPIGLPTYPVYDVAMFLASLTIIPSLMFSTVMVETDFFERYVGFYRCIQGHGNYAQIKEWHSKIVATLERSLGSLLTLQGSIAYVLIVFAPSLFAALDIPFTYLGVFRFGVLGILFHSLLLFAVIMLSYFDLRRDLVLLTGLFFVTNAALTVVTLDLGFPYYGYGYFLACVVAACAGLVLAWRRVAHLPYLAFVVCNPAVTGRAAPRILAK